MLEMFWFLFSFVLFPVLIRLSWQNEDLRPKDTSCSSKVMSDLGMYDFQNWSTNITQMF